jgi:hypothetical protein
MTTSVFCELAPVTQGRRPLSNRRLPWPGFLDRAKERRALPCPLGGRQRAVGGEDALILPAIISVQRISLFGMPMLVNAWQEIASIGINTMVRSSMAAANHMQAFFCVNAGQSARSELARVDAEVGIKSVEPSLSLPYSD